MVDSKVFGCSRFGLTTFVLAPVRVMKSGLRAQASADTVQFAPVAPVPAPVTELCVRSDSPGSKLLFPFRSFQANRARDSELALYAPANDSPIV